MAGSVSAYVDIDPQNNGGTMVRNASGGAVEGALLNPALLGTDRPARGGLRLGPVTEFGVGLWSDRLALNPFYAVGLDLNSEEGQSMYLSRVLRHSALIRKDDSPEKASERLTHTFRNGAGTYAGAGITLASITGRRVSLSLRTDFEEQFHMPSGPLLAVVSADKGLLRGTSLDMSDLSQDGAWTSEIAFNVGLPVTIPVLHEFFGLPYGAGGIGIKYVLGHTASSVWSKDGSHLTYNGDDNVLSFDGEITVQTAGKGYRGGWRTMDADAPYRHGFQVAGQGVGFDLGGILYDANRSLSINFNDLGVIVWYKDVKEVTYKFHKDSLSLYDLFRAQGLYGSSWTDSVYNRNDNQWYPRSSDSLSVSSGFVTFLPLTANIGYSRTWPLNQTKWRAQSVTAALNYEQSLSRAPGKTFIPRLSGGIETIVAKGHFPIRFGWVAGGSEKMASALGLGFQRGRFGMHGAFKAYGTPIFWPRRGFEAALGFAANWGVRGDHDKDGVFDDVDACPDRKEDVDRWQDADGCPDPDNDNDSLLDTVDRCPDVAEDRDGFNDLDGCPDPDNDGDRIDDIRDSCPDAAEDRDGFADVDGCPDYDNDGDMIPDSVDQCPRLPEDRDGFFDDDGCPDVDNDGDGMRDSADGCPDAPENYNCYKDQDGCPDTIAATPPPPPPSAPTAREIQILNKNLRGVNFESGSAQLTVASYGALNAVADFLKEYPQLRYEIQGHTDSQGADSANLKLSHERVGSVRNYLKSRGVDIRALVVNGYGEGQPIASNETASGRAQNRRVVFVPIETDEQFNVLKARSITVGD